MGTEIPQKCQVCTKKKKKKRERWEKIQLYIVYKVWETHFK